MSAGLVTIGSVARLAELPVAPAQPCCAHRGTHRPEPGVGCTDPWCLCLSPVEWVPPPAPVVAEPKRPAEPRELQDFQLRWYPLGQDVWPGWSMTRGRAFVVLLVIITAAVAGNLLIASWPVSLPALPSPPPGPPLAALVPLLGIAAAIVLLFRVHKTSVAEAALTTATVALIVAVPAVVFAAPDLAEGILTWVMGPAVAPPAP